MILRWLGPLVALDVAAIAAWSGAGAYAGLFGIVHALLCMATLSRLRRETAWQQVGGTALWAGAALGPLGIAAMLAARPLLHRRGAPLPLAGPAAEPLPAAAS